MATLKQIQDQLQQASLTNDMSLMISTLNRISHYQRFQIDAAVSREALEAIGRYTRIDDNVAARAANVFMSKLGSHVSIDAIERALTEFSHDHNLAGIDAITDHLAVNQKKNIHSFVFDNVLRDIASITRDDDKASADAARDFMKKVGSYVSADGIERALIEFSHDHNLQGIDAITDHLTLNHKENLPDFVLDHVLRDIASVTRIDDKVSADAVRDFMKKVGSYVGVQGIERALIEFSHDHNLEGIDAITDYLTLNQKGHLPDFVLGHVLRDIASITREDDKASADAARDFMTKLGGYVAIQGIERALSDFARDGNLSGIDAITDYLTVTQKENLHDFVLSHVLRDIASATRHDDLASANAARDFMSKLGKYVGLDGIERALNEFLDDSNVRGADAIVDNLSTSQSEYLKENSFNLLIGNSEAGIHSGTTQNDNIFGLGGNDILYGGEGNDILSGGAGKDILLGGEGDDILFGGAGKDTLQGKGGKDTFVLEIPSYSEIDHITDFNVSEGDVLDITGLLNGYNSLQNAIDDFVSFTQRGSVTTMYVDKDGAGTAYRAQAIVTLSEAGNLDAEQLLNNGNLVV